MSDIITVDVFTKALKNKIGMNSVEAYKIAHDVMDVFGFSNRIVDNNLSQEMRQVFYTLEDNGLLKTDREDHLLPDKGIWTLYFWKLRKDEIEKYATTIKKYKSLTTGGYSPEEVYNLLPEDAWKRRVNGSIY